MCFGSMWVLQLLFYYTEPLQNAHEGEKKAVDGRRYP